MKLVEITLTISEQDNANITDDERAKLYATADDLACDFESIAIQICRETFGSVGVGHNPQDGRVKVSIDY
tara:strand:- start:519 stop:728 length:210 start_codon:yes stop_codon:yes gene_type:complete